MAVALTVTLAWWALSFSSAMTPGQLGILNFVIAVVFDCTFISWAAFYSEYLEDLSPALQATGWAFFHGMFRFWLASAGFLQPVVAEHYGWGAWIWIVALGVVVYMVTLVVVPGHWGRVRVASPLRTAAAH
jgi:hypothetical protein